MLWGERSSDDAIDHQQGAGPHNNENPWHASYVVDTLTDLVEEAV
jgi:hypothetical protein